MTDGPVTIREVYAIAEDIRKEQKMMNEKLSEFTTSCATQRGDLDKRVTVLETKAKGNEETGKENRGNLFTVLLFVLSSLVSAVTAVGVVMLAT